MSYVANRFEQTSKLGSFHWKKGRDGTLAVKFTPKDSDSISREDLYSANQCAREMGDDLEHFKNAAANLKKADAGPDTPPALYGRPYKDEDRNIGQVKVRGEKSSEFEGRESSSMSFTGTMKFAQDPTASSLEKAFALGGVEELQYHVMQSPVDGFYGESRTLLAHSPQELVIGCGAANEYTSVMSGSLGESYAYRIGPKGQITIEETQAKA